MIFGTIHWVFREQTFHTRKDAGGMGDLKSKPQDGRFAKFGSKDPVGTKVDLSKSGWRT